MEIKEYKSKINEEIVLLLGFFDCLHSGHRKLVFDAKTLGYKTAIFTFTDKYNLKDNKVVYSFSERVIVFEKAKIDLVLFADFDDNFKNLSANDFLMAVSKNYNLKGIVCGYDYKFGKNAAGNTDTIKSFCLENNLECIISKKVEINGEKVSSSLVKKFLKEGNILKANILLSDEYFISGIVETGRKIGNTLGFPTANIHYDKHKSEIKEGVYKVYSYIDGIKYAGICNYGIKPTFNNYERTIEVFYKNYSGNLYGKNITVYFVDYIRDIIKFNEINGLKNQLNKDLEQLND